MCIIQAYRCHITNNTYLILMVNKKDYTKPFFCSVIITRCGPLLATKHIIIQMCVGTYQAHIRRHWTMSQIHNKSRESCKMHRLEIVLPRDDS